MEYFGAARRWGDAKKPHFTKTSNKYLRMMKLDIVTPYLNKIKKKLNHVTQPLSSANISIFSWKSANFALSRNTDTDCILVHNFQFF